MITLGSKVKEVNTGWEGIALGRTEHLYGCVHIVFEPTGLDKDGKPFPLHSFDEQRLEVIQEAVQQHRDPPTIKLGSRVRDMFTGFEGIVVTRTEWLHSSPRIDIQPTDLRDGKMQESQSFAERRCEVLAIAKEPVMGAHATAGAAPGSISSSVSSSTGR